MKLQGSILATKGNEESVWTHYLSAYHYVEIESVQEFDQFDAFQKYLNQEYFEWSEQNISLRGIWSHQETTYIFDPEMVDSVSEEELFSFAKLQDNTIRTLTHEKLSKSFRITQNTHQEMNELHFINKEIVSQKGSFADISKINQNELLKLIFPNLNFLAKLSYKSFKLKWTKEYQEYIAINNRDFVEMSKPKRKVKRPKWKFW